MTVPYYYRSIDFERLVRDYPPSQDYAETVFLHSRTQIEEVQNRRLLGILEWAETNPFYRKKWAAHDGRTSKPRTI
jgi:phenylacetate-CoA ligase